MGRHGGSVAVHAAALLCRGPQLQPESDSVLHSQSEEFTPLETVETLRACSGTRSPLSEVPVPSIDQLQSRFEEVEVECMKLREELRASRKEGYDRVKRHAKDTRALSVTLCEIQERFSSMEATLRGEHEQTEEQLTLKSAQLLESQRFTSELEAELDAPRELEAQMRVRDEEVSLRESAARHEARAAANAQAAAEARLSALLQEHRTTLEHLKRVQNLEHSAASEEQVAAQRAHAEAGAAAQLKQVAREEEMSLSSLHEEYVRVAALEQQERAERNEAWRQRGAVLDSEGAARLELEGMRGNLAALSRELAAGAARDYALQSRCKEAEQELATSAEERERLLEAELLHLRFLEAEALTAEGSVAHCFLAAEESSAAELADAFAGSAAVELQCAAAVGREECLDAELKEGKDALRAMAEEMHTWQLRATCLEAGITEVELQAAGNLENVLSQQEEVHRAELLEAEEEARVFMQKEVAAQRSRAQRFKGKLDAQTELEETVARELTAARADVARHGQECTEVRAQLVATRREFARQRHATQGLAQAQEEVGTAHAELRQVRHESRLLENEVQALQASRRRLPELLLSNLPGPAPRSLSTSALAPLSTLQHSGRRHDGLPQPPQAVPPPHVWALSSLHSGPGTLTPSLRNEEERRSAAPARSSSSF